MDSSDIHTVYTAERLFANVDRNDVDEAIVMGCPICGRTDNWYARRITAGYDRLHSIVILGPFANDAVERLDRCTRTDGAPSFRLGVACPYGRMWETFDPSVAWLQESIEETTFWEAAVDRDVTVQILRNHDQLDQVPGLTGAYPELTYLFDHFTHTDLETPIDEGTFGWFADLVKHDSVAVKVSEIIHMSDSVFPYTDMHDHVRWLLNTFGCERVVWGSNYLNASDVAGYAEACNQLKRADSLSKADRSQLTEKSFWRHVDLD